MRASIWGSSSAVFSAIYAFSPSSLRRIPLSFRISRLRASICEDCADKTSWRNKNRDAQVGLLQGLAIAKEDKGDLKCNSHRLAATQSLGQPLPRCQSLHCQVYPSKSI